MNNSIKIELVDKLVTAFVIVVQAVFLLFPAIAVNAAAASLPFAGFEGAPAEIRSDSGLYAIKIKTFGTMIHVPKLHLINSGLEEVSTIDSGADTDGYHIYYYNLDPSIFKANTNFCLRALVNNTYYPTNVVYSDCTNNPYKINVIYKQYEPLVVTIASPSPTSNQFYLGATVNFSAKVTNSINVSATGADVKYIIEKNNVEVGRFLGGSALNNYPYSWTPAESGDYQVTAQAANTSGDFYSQAFAVTILRDPGSPTTSQTASSTGLSLVLTAQKTSENIFQITADCNLEATVKFFIYQNTTLKATLNTVAASNRFFKTTWDATKQTAGEYTVKAIAEKTNYTTATKEADIDVSDYGLIFTDKPDASISTSTYITAQTNFKPIKAEINIHGSKSIVQTITPILVADSKYKLPYYWQTNNFTSGSYNITFTAYVNSNFSKQITTTVNYSAVQPKIADSTNTTLTTNGTDAEPENIVNDNSKSAIIAADVETEKDMQDVEPVINTIKPAINEKEPQSDVTQQPAIASTSSITASTSAQEVLSPECKDKNITDPEICREYLALDPECRGKGISAKSECDQYLQIDIICRQNNILDSGSCKKFLFNYYTPDICKRSGQETPEECSRYILDFNLPTACREADAKDISTCNEVLASQSGVSTECKTAGYNTKEECILFYDKNIVFPECESIGINTVAACQKYIYEKLSDTIFVISNQLLSACHKAGAIDEASCRQLVRKIYLPTDCQRIGLDDVDRCSSYLTDKEILPECAAAGQNSRESCNQYALKQYGPKECAKVGITNATTCDDFLFNRYANMVKCEGQDAWQCQVAIRNRYLGYLLQKQVVFAELKNNILSRSVDITQFKDVLRSIWHSSNVSLPISDMKTGIKIVKTGENILLDLDDTVRQCGPLGFMFDADQDGLPDDLEVRYGTDPKDPDSDGDSFSDGIEVENNLNPLGLGGATSKLSPIDEAIMKQRIIGQPKIQGDLNDSLLVQQIKSAADTESGKYIFSGRAVPDSIITLYIYSDLPLIAIVKVDESGNWVYELSQALPDGEHEAYIAINDNSGKVLSKSNPLNFFIREARAVSLDDYLPAATTLSQTKSKSMLSYYIIIAVLTMVIGILLFIIIYSINRSHGAADYHYKV